MTTITDILRMTRNREEQDSFISFLDQAAASAEIQAPAEFDSVGGDQGVSRLVATPDDLLRAVESGFRMEAIEALHALGLHPWEERLSHGESEAVLRVARILIHAEMTLGSRERALAWLRRSNRSFGDTAPMTLLATEAGGRRVEDLLLRADLGQMA